LSAKRSNVHNNTTTTNNPFVFNPIPNRCMITDPVAENMFSFTPIPQTKKGSGLYKDVILQNQ